MKASHVDNLQRNDVGGERVWHGSDALAQSVIFGAGASRGTSGLPHPACVAYSQADSGDPNQERPSSLCPARGSHSFCPGRVSYHSCTCNLQIKKTPHSANCSAKFAGKKRKYFWFKRKNTFLSCLFGWQKQALLRSDAGLCLCLLRLNRKAPVQRIRSARRRITNAGQTRHENREQSAFFWSWKRKYPNLPNEARSNLLSYICCLLV